MSGRTWLCCMGAAAAVAAAGCGGGGSSAAGGRDTGGSTGGQAAATTTASSGGGTCSASIGHVGPLTGPAAQLGQEQLSWDKFAVQRFNDANGTDFKVLEGDGQLKPDQGIIVARQFVSNPDVMGIVGPAGSQVVKSAGPIFGRANIAMVNMSATDAALSNGDYPTFFRVNASNTTQGPLVSDFLLGKIKPQKVMIVDDQSPDKTELADEVQKTLEQKGVTVDRESVPQTQTDFSSLVTKIDADTDAVFLSWQVPANGQQFGQQMGEQGKKAVIIGANGLYSPSEFTIDGSYVTSFAPDIRYVPGDKDLVKTYSAKYGKFGTYGPPTYSAATVIMTAIKAICDRGEKPTRQGVLDEVRKVDIEDSILGYPLHFDEHGDDPDAHFVLFHIQGGKYTPVK